MVPVFDQDGMPVTFDEAGTPLLQWDERYRNFDNVWVCSTEDSDDHIIGGDEHDVAYAVQEAKEWLRLKATRS